MSLHENQPPWELWLNRWFYSLLAIGIVVNAAAAFITILEPDGALYASIARTIAETGDYINLKVEGHDWLDKPHFPFWMAALSYRVFGINSFAYKFPALLFWGMGAWYTYRLSAAFYSKAVSQLAVLIYISAAHLVISNNDVRAEPYLTGLVIASAFHFYRASRQPLGTNLVLGSLWAAMAVMTKGPFVLITIGAGLIFHWVWKKEWQQLLHVRWLVALLLIGIFITPEIYALYLQFDSHPEKLVFGQAHVSGIRFFFWDAQFGRFFNTGPIKGSGDPFFYFHTLLWAFLPWSLLLYAAFFTATKKLFGRTAACGEYICYGASFITFIIFSLSRFQLPHYLNMLFPFFSILAASYIYGVYKNSAKKIIWYILNAVAIILPLLVLTIEAIFGFRQQAVIMGLLVLAFALPFFLFRKKYIVTAFARCWMAAMTVYAFVNFLLYPALLHYQSGSEAAFAIRNMKWDGPVYMPYEAPSSYSLQFYVSHPLRYDTLKNVPAGAMVFVTDRMGDSLERAHAYIPVAKLPHFHISQLTGTFINASTREGTLEYNRLLIKR